MPRITGEEKLRSEHEQRRRLEADLAAGRLEFGAGPYEATIQFSNVCNMSCIMCWAGANPRPRRMSSDILRKISLEVAPFLSLVTPHYGSEPLLLTWDDTRRLARERGLQLSLTTNVQFLAEDVLPELEGITQTLFLSVDSHIPEVLGRIRPGSHPADVYANLPRAARFARERGIECIANVVFLTENAAQLDATLAFLADNGVPSVSVLQMIDFNGRSGASDPLLHFSPDRVESIRQRCLTVAREKKLRLFWSVAAQEVHDFREQRIEPAARKAWNDEWDFRFLHRHPRYCLQALKAVRIDLEGEVAPCGYAAEGELSLGNLRHQSFAEVWNGPEARDLRRGMLTGDVPVLCAGCRCRDPLPPAAHKAFLDHVDVLLQRSLARVEATLEVLGPDHMTRQATPPRIRLRRPEHGLASYHLALSPGGEPEGIETCELRLKQRGEGSLELAIPSGLWRRLKTNVGYWWAVFGFPARPAEADGEADLVGRITRALRRRRTAPQGGDEPAPPAYRSAEVRCLVRHADLPRVAGSRLRYASQGHRANRDLGGGRAAGARNGGSAT